MPQIGVQQPTNLMEMFSSPSPMMWDIARNQVQDQTLGNALNRAQAQQSMDFEKQKQPYELRQLGLANDTTAAQLPGVQANSSLAQDKATVSRNTISEQQQKAISDIAKSIKDNDLNMAESEIQRNLLHSDPAVRKQAEQMWPLMSKIREEKMKYQMQGDAQARIASINVKSQKELEQMRIDAGKYLKANTLNAKVRLDSLVKPIEIDAALRQILSDENLSDKERAQYMARFNENAKALATENSVRTASNAGKLNVPEMTGTPGIETPAVQPVGQPASAVPALKSNYSKDTVYQGRTGRYRYKGGDPANQDNWEKVE